MAFFLVVPECDMAWADPSRRKFHSAAAGKTEELRGRRPSWPYFSCIISQQSRRWALAKRDPAISGDRPIVRELALAAAVTILP